MEPTEAMGLDGTPHGGAAEHVVPYSTFIRVWALLLALTAVLVLVSELAHELLSVPALLTVTPLKAGLVFYYFMHLKYESTLLKTMLAVALASLVVFLLLLFSDLSFR